MCNCHRFRRTCSGTIRTRCSPRTITYTTIHFFTIFPVYHVAGIHTFWTQPQPPPPVTVPISFTHHRHLKWPSRSPTITLITPVQVVSWIPATFIQQQQQPHQSQQWGSTTPAQDYTDPVRRRPGRWCCWAWTAIMYRLPGWPYPHRQAAASANCIAPASFTTMDQKKQNHPGHWSTTLAKKDDLCISTYTADTSQPNSVNILKHPKRQIVVMVQLMPWNVRNLFCGSVWIRVNGFVMHLKRFWWPCLFQSIKHGSILQVDNIDFSFLVSLTDIALNIH